jgi:integrase
VSIRHDLHALSPFYRYAIKHTWARQNPVEEVEIPSDADAVRIHVLSPAEEMLYFEKCLMLASRLEYVREDGKIVKVPEWHKRGYQDMYDLGRLMIKQGPRPEELRELEWADVNLERGTIFIRRGKTKAARRRLRLAAESREILARRLRECPGRWVFPSHKNPGDHIAAHQRVHDNVLAEMGSPDGFVVYDFRHTFATRAANDEHHPMSLSTLAAILGHNNLRSVHKYVHVQQADMDRAMQRMDEDSVPVLFRSGAVATSKTKDLTVTSGNQESAAGKRVIN